MDYFRTLDELQPDDIADKALAAILRHVAGFAMGLDFPRGSELQDLEIYGVTQRLTEYAQRGLPVRDWTDSSQVEEGLHYALNTLYASACFRGRIDFDLIGRIEADGEYDYLHLVLVAATARWQLLEEWDSIKVNALRVLAAHRWEGDEEFSDSYVDPEVALSWLIEREVPGFNQADLDKLREACPC